MSLFPPDIVQRLSTTRRLSSSSSSCLLWSPVLIIPRLRATISPLPLPQSGCASYLVVTWVPVVLLDEVDFNGTSKKKSRLETTHSPTRRSKPRARVLRRCFCFSFARYTTQKKRTRRCEARRRARQWRLNCRPAEPIG